MTGRENRIKYPMGNKFRRLIAVVEARRLLSDKLTKQSGGHHDRISITTHLFKPNQTPYLWHSPSPPRNQAHRGSTT